MATKRSREEEVPTSSKIPRQKFPAPSGNAFADALAIAVAAGVSVDSTGRAVGGAAPRPPTPPSPSMQPIRTKKKAPGRTIIDDEQEEEHREDVTRRLTDVEGEEDGEDGKGANGDTWMEDGIEIEPFNLKAELKTGFFDADGHYQWRTGTRVDEAPSVKEDPWQADYEAWEAQQKKKGPLGKPMEAKEEEEPLAAPVDLDALRVTLKKLLQPGENALQALRRLKGKEHKMEFEAVTEAADALLLNGDGNGYSYTPESIAARGHGASAHSSGKHGKQKKQWLYKWSLDTQEEYGPYSTEKMLEWAKLGFFRAQPVMIHCIGTPGWRAIAAVDELRHEK